MVILQLYILSSLLLIAILLMAIYMKIKGK